MRALKGAGVDLNNVCTAIMDVFGNPDPRGRPQTGALRTPLRRAETRILDQYSLDLTENRCAEPRRASSTSTAWT